MSFIFIFLYFSLNYLKTKYSLREMEILLRYKVLLLIGCHFSSLKKKKKKVINRIEKSIIE